MTCLGSHSKKPGLLTPAATLPPSHTVTGEHSFQLQSRSSQVRVLPIIHRALGPQLCAFSEHSLSIHEEPGPAQALSTVHLNLNAPRTPAGAKTAQQRNSAPKGLAAAITLSLAYLQAHGWRTVVPMAGIEDEVEENGLDTNKKLAQVGGSWNTAPKYCLSLGAREIGTPCRPESWAPNCRDRKVLSCLNPYNHPQG